MLSKKTKQRLVLAMTRKSLADELEAKMDSAAPLSAKLKRAIEVALASKKAAQDLIAVVEAGSGSLKKDTQARIIQEMAQKAAGQEVIASAQA